MLKSLIWCQNYISQEVVQQSVEQNLHITCHPISDLKEAREMMKTFGPHIHFIYVDNLQEKTIEICELIQEWDRKNQTLPAFFINDQIDQLEKDLLASELNNMVSIKAIQDPQDIFQDQHNQHLIKKSLVEDHSFSPIRLYQFLQFSSAPWDIYLKLKNQKFIKIVKKDEFFTKEILQKYDDKKIKYVYIESQYLEDYLIFLSQKMSELTNDAPCPLKLKQELNTIQLDTSYQILDSLGMTTETLQSSQQIVSHVLEHYKKFPIIWNYIKETFKGHNFQGTHAISLAYITCAMAHHLKWKSEITYSSLIIASLLHDLKIHNEKSVLIQDMKSPLFDSLSDDERKKFLEHPHHMALALAQIPDIPLQAITIIEQHHERPDGSGFPKKLCSYEISLLSTLFIVAEDFFHQMFALGFDPEQRNLIIKNLSQKYSQGNFSKAMNALNEIFISEEQETLYDN